MSPLPASMAFSRKPRNVTVARSTGRNLPARVDPGFLIGRRKRRAPEDVVGGFLARHDRRGIQVSVGHPRKDRGVGDAQAFDADDAAFGIDDAHRVAASTHPAGAAGVIGAFGMLADEAVEFLIALHLAARRYLPAAICVERGLAKNLARQADAPPEIRPVVRVRHVVEADFRFGPWVGRTQGNSASRLRSHRPDMRLEAVRFRRRPSVVAHRGGNEMVLDVRVVDAGRGTHEGGCLEMVRCAEAGLEEQPLGADQRFRKWIEDRVERDRLDRFLLDIELHVILQVLSDARPVRDDRDAVFLELFRRTDARQHQELWRIDRRSGDDDFAFRFNDLNLFASFDFDTGRALILDDHAPREAIDQTHVFAPEGRAQIGVGGRPAAAAENGLFHGAEAFLLGAVVVVGQFEPGLVAGFDEGCIKRVGARSALDVQRTVLAAPAVLAAHRILHALEIGKHVGKPPAGSAFFRPVIEVAGMAADIDHAVDR